MQIAQIALLPCIAGHWALNDIQHAFKVRCPWLDQPSTSYDKTTCSRLWPPVVFGSRIFFWDLYRYEMHVLNSLRRMFFEPTSDVWLEAVEILNSEIEHAGLQSFASLYITSMNTWLRPNTTALEQPSGITALGFESAASPLKNTVDPRRILDQYNSKVLPTQQLKYKWVFTIIDHRYPITCFKLFKYCISAKVLPHYSYLRCQWKKNFRSWEMGNFQELKIHETAMWSSRRSLIPLFWI